MNDDEPPRPTTWRADPTITFFFGMGLATVLILLVATLILAVI